MEGLEQFLRILALVSVGFTIVEAITLRFVLRWRYNLRSALASLAMLLGRSISDRVPLTIAMPGSFLLYEHRLLDAEALGVWMLPTLFVGLEFVYYWWHRVSHGSRWFWTYHAVHHSPNALNFADGSRVGWNARIMATFVIFSPLAVLGFNPSLIFLAYSTNLAYQFWLHSAWFPKLGPLEGVLNTPSAHRVHHAANTEYLDSNFGGVLVVFDRLFGTYRAERQEIPIRYGLVSPLETNNPFKIAFHQFGPMLRDLVTARNPLEVVGYLFGPPGWRPRDKR